MSRDKTCAERLPEQLQGRIEDLRALYARIDGTDEADSEAAREELDEFPLGVSVVKVLRVDLSTGGPQDYFTVELDEDGRISGKPRYHFLDWFDGAEQGTDDEAVARFLDYYAEVASYAE